MVKRRTSKAATTAAAKRTAQARCSHPSRLAMPLGENESYCPMCDSFVGNDQLDRETR